ncbi:hypothetical protein F5884DRAFT_391358 [Xylogone sp. PMI_703]|nr:hypothetical protein F5884DRAFT_391358 [Xylogone sp. PMI_703]
MPCNLQSRTSIFSSQGFEGLDHLPRCQKSLTHPGVPGYSLRKERRSSWCVMLQASHIPTIKAWSFQLPNDYHVACFLRLEQQHLAVSTGGSAMQQGRSERYPPLSYQILSFVPVLWVTAVDLKLLSGEIVTSTLRSRQPNFLARRPRFLLHHLLVALGQIITVHSYHSRKCLSGLAKKTLRFYSISMACFAVIPGIQEM